MNKKSTPSNQELNSYLVQEDTELLKYLISNYPNKKKALLKQVMGGGQIRINGDVITQFNHGLKKGDEIQINWAKPSKKVKLQKLNILYEDQDLIVIEKEAGLLSVASLKEKKKNAVQILKEHMEAIDPRIKVYIIHRLEREASGILLFAKSQKIQELLQNSWEDYVIDRKYIAIVEGKIKESSHTLRNYLRSNKNNQVFIVNTPENATEAITHFNLLKQSNAYSMLEFKLETGFKNQIRVQMAHFGFPVTGDKKYTAKKNPLGRVALHANLMELKHPISGEHLKFELVPPSNFRNLVAKG
ncbi:23S rRNA pseudouridine1911/1915/1917 synthase [Marivirga sericea]|uniref:23S rRNA pseudouridine1911/1915/1917 synthase n=1 Tax=Marivirga sericea TaxID=1028 RepID=A0A1X7JWL1_9BACT|nr:RluA family pseudouridine synthase [Marivirga sericea]SMG32741.1 23S rRNA pseudouridine1911/1915/1917 synthase [Marivirga sericea]